MGLQVGAKLPEAKLMHMGANGPEAVELSAKLKGRKVVIFALPGAFTGTCTTAHLPSFIRTKAGFDAKGVDEIICLSVNDPFALGAWAQSTGGAKAGITFLGDSDGSLTKTLDMVLHLPHIGLNHRSKRYAIYVVDGVVQVLHHGEESAQCEISGGEALLAAI